MIWATVSSQSCFWWLYRASPSLSIWEEHKFQNSRSLLWISASCSVRLSHPRVLVKCRLWCGVWWVQAGLEILRYLTSFHRYQCCWSLGLTLDTKVDLESVQFSCSVVSESLPSHGLEHARLPCPSPTPGVHSNSSLLVGDAIQPSHPLSSASPPALILPQHQGLF